MVARLGVSGALGCAALAGLLISAACAPSPPSPPPILIFAAASLRDVATELGAAFEAADGRRADFNFAGSNTLAQQIEHAPGADVFLSADPRWLDPLERAGRLLPGTRREIFANRLVVVARPDAGLRVESLAELADVVRADDRRLVLAEPSAVPAGRYARAYLEGAVLEGSTVWEKVRERVVPALDARAALALVESDPRHVGMVYRTDALSSSRVAILLELPEVPEIRVVYAAAAVAGGTDPAGGRLFLDFLAGDAAREIVRRHGFLPLD